MKRKTLRDLHTVGKMYEMERLKKNCITGIIHVHPLYDTDRNKTKALQIMSLENDDIPQTCGICRPILDNINPVKCHARTAKNVQCLRSTNFNDYCHAHFKEVEKNFKGTNCPNHGRVDEIGPIYHQCWSLEKSRYRIIHYHGNCSHGVCKC
jgi:hypothetical protein